MVMVVLVLLVVVVARTGIRDVGAGVRVAHHPRMTGEPCCSTSTTTPWPHLQPGRACGDRRESAAPASAATRRQLLPPADRETDHPDTRRTSRRPVRTSSMTSCISASCQFACASAFSWWSFPGTGWPRRSRWTWQERAAGHPRRA